MKDNHEAEAAFVLHHGDRFRCIIVSDSVKYETDPAAETVITFFTIRRRSGLHDIVNISKTFRGDRCVSRTVQAKHGIPAGRIDREVEAISTVFAKGIRDATGYRIVWHRIDLSGIKGVAEQVSAVAAWGRVGVRAAKEIPPAGRN